MSVGKFSELNSSPGNLWLLNLLLCFCRFSSLLFAVAGLCSRQLHPVWTNGCWNHSQFLDHLLQSVFITSCSVLWLLPYPGSYIAYINCTPLLSLLLGLVLNWQLALFTLNHLNAFLLCAPGVGEMDKMEMTRTSLSWWLLPMLCRLGHTGNLNELQS